MPLRRSFFASALAAIAVAAPLGLQADDYFYPPQAEVCPPGNSTYQPQIVCPPAPSPAQPAPDQSMPSQGQQGMQTPQQAPGQQAAPGQQPGQGQQPAQGQQPQMAAPTFNPSASPTTAATSASATAPNMIGDLFGTGATQKVVISPSPIVFTPAPVNVPFLVEDLAVSFSPYGFSNPSSVAPNVVFMTNPEMVTATDFNTGALVSLPISSSTFTSQLPTALINGGVPLTPHVGPSSPDFLTNPPAAGTYFDLDDGSGAYQGDVSTLYTTVKPGVAFQQAAYVGVNGPGTFSGQSGENVTFEDATATLATDNGITGPTTAAQIETVDEFYVQQEVHYDPGMFVFQPDDVLIPVPSILLDLPALGALPGANVGRQKLTENTSPLPQNRIFVNYSFFSDTPLRPSGVDVNRITPGFETTFFNGLMSFELRTPFASTLSSDLIAGGMGSTNETEFGNVTMYWKTLLWEDSTKAFSTGLGVALPSASDVKIRTADGTPLLQVENEAIHALPFIGGVWNPTPQTFVQGIAQFDFDTRGNPVKLSSFQQGQPTGILQEAGRPNDADYVFFDLSIGRWIYQNQSGHGLLTGFAPLVELHYNRTINQADNVVANVEGASILLDSTQDTNLFNGVVGGTALLCNNASVTVAYSTPLSDSDKQFEGELRIIVNWLFGGPRRGVRGLNF